MGEEVKKLAEVFRDHFGFSGDIILAEFLKEHKVEFLASLDDQKKMELAEEMLEEIFGDICSANKCEMVRARIYSALGIPFSFYESMQAGGLPSQA